MSLCLLIVIITRVLIDQNKLVTNNLDTSFRAKDYIVENFNINPALSILAIIGVKKFQSTSYRNNIAQLNESAEKGEKSIYL